MIIDPYRFPPSPGALDGFTTNIWGAFGLKKLVGPYTGPALRLRRASNDAEQDIGFTGDALNLVAMAAFANFDVLFVVTWYDQSGNGNHLTQSTKAKQPRIYDGGGVGYFGHLFFDGTDDQMDTTATSGTPTAFTVFVSATTNDLTPTKIIFEHSNDAGSNKGAAAYTGSPTSNKQLLLMGSPPSGYMQNYFAIGTLPNGTDVNAYRFDRTQAAEADRATLFVAGSQQTRDGAASSGSFDVGSTFDSEAWHIGARADGSLQQFIDYRAFVIYESAKSDSDISSISAALT